MTRSDRSGSTRLQFLLASGVAAVLALGTLGVVQRGSGGDQDAAMATARRIVTAASDWKREHREVGCPTVSQLIVDRNWRRDEPSDDPWGGRFRIRCSSDEVNVRSPGRDGRFETDDDVLATAAWES